MSEAITIGSYEVKREFVRRRELAVFGMKKLPAATAYMNAYVIRKDGKIEGYALTEEDAREWVDAQTSGGEKKEES